MTYFALQVNRLKRKCRGGARVAGVSMEVNIGDTRWSGCVIATQQTCTERFGDSGRWWVEGWGAGRVYPFFSL